ncbi:DUF4439 domain-containing protein [Paeniglutamicibacter antarcticus]|uniref:DUF4439 domain-containing protein n=1 Tax=Arthrobacter terrae TaxID=2935737 RepID=A0A931GA20_9MICC|nr:DUF4439 domain-containing protein [Arthrobacter terrae]
MTDSRSPADWAADDDARQRAATSSSTPRRTRRTGLRRAGADDQLSAPVETKVTPPSRIQATGTNLHRAGRIVRRLLLLLLTGAIVLGMGTVVVSVKPGEAGGPSASGLARADALNRVTTLAGSAAALQATASVPAVVLKLRNARTMLDAYAAALSLRSDETPGSATAAASTAEQTNETQAAPAGIPELIQGLVDASTASLTAARTAPGGMARVLASGGTAALMQARSLAGDLGLPVPQSPYLDASSTLNLAEPGGAGPGGQGPGGASGTPETPGIFATAVPAPASTPAPCATQQAAPAGVNEDQALLTAVEAEHKAIYAYQVAATRLTDPTSRLAVHLLSDHESTLSSLQDLLSTRCLPQPVLQPGYELAPGFTAAPAAALAALEDQLATVYAQLLALSDPAGGGSTPVVRTTAIMALVQNARHRWSWGPPEVPLPGIDLPDAPPAAPSRMQK